MKIEKYFDKKQKKDRFRARFQFNHKEFFPSAGTRKELLEIIDEIKSQENRAKYNLAVPVVSPALAELFIRHAPKIPKDHQRTLFDRVSEHLLKLLPEDIKITDLKKAHFQKYIDFRSEQVSKHTKKNVLGETIDKELYAISTALNAAPRYFPELDEYRKPEIPKAAPKGKKRRRSRLVNKENELEKLLSELRKEREGKQTLYTEMMRRQLADDLEFRFETGLRRKEVARLKANQYFRNEAALREVIRWKTGTITPFFPLTRRAVALVENRLKLNPDCEYLFTDDGEPVDSYYRTLREVCIKLEINYGRYKDGGWTGHDLRHNFASEIIRHTDIETTRELLGHSNIEQTSVYLQTNEDRMREAVLKGEKPDISGQVAEIYKGVRRGKIKLRELIKIIENMARK